MKIGSITDEITVYITVECHVLLFADLSFFHGVSCRLLLLAGSTCHSPPDWTISIGCFFQYLSHAIGSNCARFCFSAVCDFLFCFFVCESNISGTAERICAKFTGKTCLVPRSDEFECQGQRSRSQGTKTRCALLSGYHPRQRRNGMRSLQITSCSSRRDHSVAGGGDFGGLRACLCLVNIFSL